MYIEQQRQELGCDEPIYLLPYSNGSNVALSALRDQGMSVDGTVFIGGATDTHTYGIRAALRSAGKVVNYYSATDRATWWVNGIGHFGLPSLLGNHYIDGVFHSANEALGQGYTIPATSDSRVGGYTHWLTNYMTTKYYASDLQYDGECCISELGILRRPFGLEVGLDNSLRIYNSGERNKIRMR